MQTVFFLTGTGWMQSFAVSPEQWLPLENGEDRHPLTSVPEVLLYLLIGGRPIIFINALAPGCTH